MNDLTTMLHKQVQENLTRTLDAAVQAGDIAAARNATKQIAELALSTAPAPAKPKLADADIRAALKTKAPWFGTDPRKSAKAVEFGKNMDPEAFTTAEAFADAVVKAVDEEFKTAEPEEKEDEETEEDEKEEKPAARKKTDAPSGDTGRSASRGKSSGPWAKLSDAPKDVAETIRKQADKFTRNAPKEARDKFISTALGSAYAAQSKGASK
jgi:hypothetical protein